MSDVRDLHRESKIMPVRPHIEMISAQFYATTCTPTHISNGLTQPRVQPVRRRARLAKRSLRDMVAPVVATVLPDGHNHPKEDCAAASKRLHTDYATSSINSTRHSKLLAGPAPEIDAEELNLSRRHRSLLAQLRTGYCSLLNDYLSRIDPTKTPDCPTCPGSTHNVAHFLDCPKDPRTFAVLDLWKRPQALAEAMLPPPLPESS